MWRIRGTGSTPEMDCAVAQPTCPESPSEEPGAPVLFSGVERTGERKFKVMADPASRAKKCGRSSPGTRESLNYLEQKVTNSAPGFGQVLILWKMS